MDVDEDEIVEHGCVGMSMWMGMWNIDVDVDGNVERGCGWERGRCMWMEVCVRMCGNVDMDGNVQYTCGCVEYGCGCRCVGMWMGMRMWNIDADMGVV